MRQLAAGLVGWGGAVGLAASFADVAPWRCGLALLLAAAALAPGPGPAVRAVLAGLAALPVLDAGQHLAEVWGLLALGSVSAIGATLRPRLGVAAALAVGAALAGAVQGPAPLLAFGALVALSTPMARWSAAAVLAAGGVALVQAVTLSWRVASEPLVEAARLVADRRADRLEPLLATRALQALDDGDLDGVRAVIRAAPAAVVTGEALAAVWGVEQALDAGWEPEGPVTQEIALPLAWALHDRGREGAARRVLERLGGPLAAVHLAAMRAEQTGEPQRPEGPVPDGAVEVPGLLVVERGLAPGEEGQVVLVAPDGLTELVVVAEAAEVHGSAELVLLVGGLPWGPLPTGRWTLDVALPAGAWRVGWRLDATGSPAHDGAGTDLRIEAR